MRLLAKALVVGMALLVAAGILAPVGGIAQQESGTDTVTVAARRKVEVEPDVAIVALGVRGRGASAEVAADRLAVRMDRVIAALEAAGFTDEEIETFDVELFRRCISRCRSRTDRVFGFVGSAGIRVRTQQIDRVGEIIDVGIDAGASSIRSVAFDVSDKDEAEKEALRQAMLFAIEKARVLAEAAGRTVGQAIVIEEGRTEAPERFAVGGDALAAARVSAGGGTAFPIEPPTLFARARVEVTFVLN